MTDAVDFKTCCKWIARFENRNSGERRIGLAGLPLLLLLLLPQTAHCAPNGYTQIPIAKVFGNGVAAFSLNMSDLGYPRSLFSTVYTMQYGLLNRFEAGFDYQAQPSSQETWLGNAKYLLMHEPGRLPDVACGVINVASHEKALPYLVATTQPGNLGISLGLTGSSTTRGLTGMGGLAYNLSPTVQIVADIIGGGRTMVRSASSPP